jgi:hypothetical protein
MRSNDIIKLCATVHCSSSAAVNESQQHRQFFLQKTYREGQESNPGRLGGKPERYLCAMPTLLLWFVCTSRETSMIWLARQYSWLFIFTSKWYLVRNELSLLAFNLILVDRRPASLSHTWADPAYSSWQPESYPGGSLLVKWVERRYQEPSKGLFNIVSNVLLTILIFYLACCKRRLGSG